MSALRAPARRRRAGDLRADRARAAARARHRAAHARLLRRRARRRRPAGRRRPDRSGAAGLGGDAAFRRHLWAHGLRVAEAMDTAQRGMGLDWAATQELIRRSVAEAKAVGGQLACGAGTDQLARRRRLAGRRAPRVRGAARVHRGRGRAGDPDGQPRAGAAATRRRRLPRGLRRRCSRRRAAGDPALAGRHVRPAARRLLGCAATSTTRSTWSSASSRRNVDKVDGIKVSLLDAGKEIALRGRLPEGVQMYTGDDFNYPELIRATAGSHALLGIFDAIAPAAAAAMHALDDGRPRPLRRAAGADRPALAPHLRRAHPVLQDGRRLPRLPQRPPAALPDGRRAGERALGRCIWPSCSCSPTGRGCCAIPSSRARACGACSRWRACDEPPALASTR